MSRYNSEEVLTKASLVASQEQLFRCPICKSSMRVNRLSSLDCSNGHCFDISKHGYVNLLPRPSKSKYDKSLFVSRSMISNSGFFDPLIEYVCDLLIRRRESHSEIQTLLDAGCGEGSHLRSIISNLEERPGRKRYLGTGIDIAKEGILLASKASPDLVWCVADLAHSPFADRQFDAIVNILSPSNYAEFGRLLKEDGVLIKVIPGKSYLQELRELLYGRKSRERDSSGHTIELFSRYFELIETKEIRYRKRLSPEESSLLVQMTPLAWGASPELKMSDNLPRELEVTVDFTVLYGKPKPVPAAEESV
ncbi:MULTISPECIES: putative RNA methyltransferase [unclassified Paenibacillus]|uniref:putative RNA methyltransferase n=1 Tax=unclassified Paenibacillus TaxID=185978 RepID=UPI0030F60F5D